MRTPFLIAVVAIALASPAQGADEPAKYAEPQDDSSRYAVETIVGELNSPTSVAVRNGTGATAPIQLYIAEAGAGRVVRVIVGAEGEAKPTPVVTGFALADRGPLHGGRVGPLSVAFLTANRLLVGTGGLGDGADLVSVYSLSDNDAELSYDQADHSAGPVASSNRSTSGEGAFADIAGTDDACFVAARSGDARGWVLKATVDANRIAGLEPFVAMQKAAGNERPTAVVVDPRPKHHYLLVATCGELDGEADSRVTMVSPTSGDVALNLATGLRDIVALAYSPSGDLYAADLAVDDPAAGGVFRLEAAQVDGRESCRAVKIAAATRPTALAFTPDGALYVTALGDAGEDNGTLTGALLKITPQGDTPKL